MKAARIHRYGGPEEFRIDEVPVPPVGPLDIRVANRAAAVNPVDFKVRGGYQKLFMWYRLPWILGMDCAGIVDAVGPEVTRFQPGDAVYASPHHRRPGTYAEYSVMHEREAALMPEGVTFAEAAGIPLAGLTAWHGIVVKGRIGPGQRLFVPAGSGGVGTLAIQIAKAHGAWVATSCSSRNIELVQTLGADLVVDYTCESIPDRISEPVDLVFDTMGQSHRDDQLAILKRGGRLVSIATEIPDLVKRYGHVGGTLAGALEMVSWPVLSRTRRGVKGSNIVRPPDGNMLAQITDLVEAGKVKPVVDRIFPLAEIADAHRYSETGRARGKIIIDIDGQAQTTP